MSDILTRRDFLFIGGATVAGVTLGEAAVSYTHLTLPTKRIV